MLQVRLPGSNPFQIAASESTTESARPLRVAVADDEAELRIYFARALPHLGYTVTEIVATGEELVKQCQRSPPEVVICDVQLAGISGPEAVATIREQFSIAAVYITENSHEDKAASAAAYCGILTKPFRMHDLTPAIQRAVAERPG